MVWYTEWNNEYELILWDLGSYFYPLITEQPKSSRM